MVAVALPASSIYATAEPVEQSPERTAQHLTGPKSPDILHLKFAEGTAVRLRGGALVSHTRAPMDRAQRLLAGAGVEPLFTGGEAELDRLHRPNTPNLNQWYRVKVRPGTNIQRAAAELAALDVIETAYPEPLGERPPSPDYTARQGYTDAGSASGIDSDHANTVPGGTGGNVRVVDIEYGWHTNHEDLSKLRLSGALIPNGTPRFSYQDHGTAVLGEIGSDANGSGTTGIVPDAGLHMTNVDNQRGWDGANAILTAARAVSPGDVILLEQQTSACGGYAPIEVIASVYDAIRTAVAAGVHVVEAAGNGNRNLDDACFGSTFPSGKADSGAIIVGAGAAANCGRTPRSKLSFSTYGSRVNLQGWGECVASTGYGDLYGSGSANNYTAKFSGTSSASPIVAGAVAAISSIAEQRGITLTPAQMRDLLVRTGSPQQGTGGKIGPMPNLRAAIESLGGGGGNITLALNPTAGSVTAGGSTTATASVTGTDQPARLTASGAPAGVSVAFSPDTVGPGGTSTMTVSTTASATPGTYPITVTGAAASGTGSATYSLTVTGAGGTCGQAYTGTLAQGATAIQPGGTWYQSTSAGTHKGCLDGPNGTDFDLYLDKWNGSDWNAVAQSNGGTPDESITYSGTAGYYRYRVVAYTGGGAYTFSVTKP
ncbi:bifunctional protein [Alloactinosynnema sp. L-07]|nr:bifunctional protein [Alloactinosynnema sp. L-07]